MAALILNKYSSGCQALFIKNKTSNCPITMIVPIDGHII